MDGDTVSNGHHQLRLVDCVSKSALELSVDGMFFGRADMHSNKAEDKAERASPKGEAGKKHVIDAVPNAITTQSYPVARRTYPMRIACIGARQEGGGPGG